MRSFKNVLSNDVILDVASSGDLENVIFEYIFTWKSVRLLYSHFLYYWSFKTFENSAYEVVDHIVSKYQLGLM